VGRIDITISTEDCRVFTMSTRRLGGAVMTSSHRARVRDVIAP